MSRSSLSPRPELYQQHPDGIHVAALSEHSDVATLWARWRNGTDLSRDEARRLGAALLLWGIGLPPELVREFAPLLAVDGRLPLVLSQLADTALLLRADPTRGY